VKTVGKTPGRPISTPPETLGKTGKTEGRPAPPLTCAFTGAREDREDRRRTLHSASGAAAPVFPSSLGLMGEDGKTAPRAVAA
jgi:hypothetical protein